MALRRDRGLAFWSATVALISTFAVSASPVPLFNTYRSELGFTNADISFAVVAYFAGTIGSLLFLGRLSGHIGRRPTSLATLALVACGAVVLFNVQSLPLLVVGRLLMGAGSGLASSSITAYIVDAAPASPLWIASVASSQAPNLGLAIGAIGSGGLVELGPWPTHLVYVVGVCLLILAGVGIAASPETVPRSPGAWRSLRPQIHVPPRVRHLLPVAAAVFVGTWSMGACYQAFVPALVADQLGSSSSLVFGVVFTSYMVPNVVGAPISGRFTSAGAQRLGMSVFLIGVAGLLTGVVFATIAVFIVSSAIAGGRSRYRHEWCGARPAVGEPTRGTWPHLLGHLPDQLFGRRSDELHFRPTQRLVVPGADHDRVRRPRRPRHGDRRAIRTQPGRTGACARLSRGVS